MDKYVYWLDRKEGLGTIAKKNLMDAFGNGQEIYMGQEKYLKYILDEKKLALVLKAQKELEVEKPWEEAWKDGIEMVWYSEHKFPEKLKNIPDSPFCVYYKGKLPDDTLPSVAVIGARECSQYGEYIAQELGRTFGEQGIQLISGMAKGIDGISQMAALEAGGASFGVLGCGVDVCYPKSNQRLYKELMSIGGIISTYPPGTQPQARLFPPRNRIVSGLADVLVVIEARQKSGTYITVEMALEQGREIYAVPGRVTDRLSDGCNKMLKDGAHVFLSPQDFLLDLQELLPSAMDKLQEKQCRDAVFNEWKLGNNQVQKGEWKQEELDFSAVAEEEDILIQVLLEVLDFYPQSVETIAWQIQQKYQISQKPEELTSKLMYMCLYGLAKQESSGWFLKVSKNE